MEMKQLFSENSSRRLLRKPRNLKRIIKADHHHRHQAPHHLAPPLLHHHLDLDHLHLLIPTNTRKDTAVLALDKTNTIIMDIESMAMASTDSTTALDHSVDLNYMDSVCHLLLHNSDPLEDSTHNSKDLETSHLLSSIDTTDLIIMAVMDLTMVVITMDLIMVRTVRIWEVLMEALVDLARC